MSINGVIQEISVETLRLFQQDTSLVESFINEFDSEIQTDIDKLELNQWFDVLTFLLAGYNPGYLTSEVTTILELRESKELMLASKNRDFAAFTVIEESKWDGLPLVNAFGAGVEIGDEMGYGKVRYLTSELVQEILRGLVKLGREGYQRRVIRTSEDTNLPFDLDEDNQEFVMEYFEEILDYYQNASSRSSAMLLYLT
jgi:hypothetical protein